MSRFLDMRAALGRPLAPPGALLEGFGGLEGGVPSPVLWFGERGYWPALRGCCLWRGWRLRLCRIGHVWGS